MGNIEKPLTWGLVIVFVGYLFVANCECDEESVCSLNNGFNITNAGINSDFEGFDTLADDEDFTEDTGPRSFIEDTAAINKYIATARRMLGQTDSVAPGAPPGVVWVVDRQTGVKENYYQVRIGGIVMYEKAKE